jgi:hypothetical protein
MTRLAIVVALVVGGIAVLANGFSDGASEVAPSPDTEPTPPESPSPPKPPDEIVPQQEGVLVQVLNGTFTAGLAADLQATLEQGGYLPADDAGDAPEKPILDTVVYFRPDDHADQNRADAGLLSEEYLAGAPVERLPADYREAVDPAADVIVVLGEDMQGSP